MLGDIGAVASSGCLLATAAFVISVAVSICSDGIGITVAASLPFSTAPVIVAAAAATATPATSSSSASSSPPSSSSSTIE